MPRIELKRKTAGAATGPGAAKSVVAVKVTYDSHIPKATIEKYSSEIIKAVEDVGSRGITKGLHQTSKVRGVGNLKAIGYIHGHGDVCLLVTRVDPRNMTIQIDKVGDVNNGVHVFK